MVWMRKFQYLRLYIFISGMLVGVVLFNQFQTTDICIKGISKEIDQEQAQQIDQEQARQIDQGEVEKIEKEKDRQIEKKSDNASKCTEKRKDIAFLKVHKCGSTTVSNILQRFGLKYDLNFVLADKPHDKHFWVLGKVTDLKDADIIGLPAGETYNILAVDTVFDAKAYRKLIPHNAFFLAIVRDPVDRFVSKDFYEGRGKSLLKMHGLDPYVYSHLTNQSVNEQSALLSMGYDFGLPIIERYQEDYIQQTLQHVDKEFDFVMVMEYFDESLVILKRLLCWDTADIIYITRNVHFWDPRVYALSVRDRDVIRSLVPADVKIYDHFRQKLQKQMLNLGQDFLEEVHHFKTILKLIQDFCSHERGPFELVIPGDTWTKEFKIDRDDCELMMLREFPLVKRLQIRQWKKINVEHEESE